MTERRRDGKDTAAPDDDAPASQQEEKVEQEFNELVAGLERERDEYLKLAQRTQADFENYRKRVAKEARDAEARGRAQLVRELLPVADNLERALENIAADPQADRPVRGGTIEQLAEGVRLVHEELSGVLRSAGVSSYEPLGDDFDPDWHEAVMTRPVNGKAGKVVEVVQKGYRLDGQVLRPARVVVGAQAPESEEEATR